MNRISAFILIAVVATMVNLVLQALWVFLYTGPAAVETSIVLATVVVLPLKYLADKRWVYGTAQPTPGGFQPRLFFAYAFTGGVSTLVFWSIEYGFHWVFQDDLMRYLGGFIGLSLSFFMKYQADRRLVFRGR